MSSTGVFPLNDVAQLSRDVTAPAQARALVQNLAPHLDAEVLVDAKLLVSELITNSVKYGGEGAVTLEIQVEGPRRLRIEVVDQGAGFRPVARPDDRTEPGGWGLELVGEIADRWGTHQGSTHVWFEIDR